METKPKGLDSDRTRSVIKVMARANVWLYRRTGTLRTTPLVYLEDGPRIVVVASQAGRAEHPMWYLNLLAHPEVVVQVRSDRRPMHARVADPDERDQLWPRLVDLYADFDSYQSWTERVIPVVVLEPR